MQGSRRRRRRFLLALPLVLGGFALDAVAVDGLVEINQARALAGGVTPGDTPGFPVTLSERGSYRLTGNLTAPPGTGAGLTFVDVTTNEVTFDLNGFSIVGETVCTPGSTSVSCTPSTGAHAIRALGRDVVVRNGTVRGAAGFGIYLGSNCRVEDVQALHNAYAALGIGDDCVVRRLHAHLNGAAIVTDRPIHGGVFEENVIVDNGTGMSVGSACLITRNVLRRNRGTGILATGACTISDNAVEESPIGIQVNRSSIVTGNTVRTCPVGIKLSFEATGIANNAISGSGTPICGLAAGLGTNLCEGVPCGAPPVCP